MISCPVTNQPIENKKKAYDDAKKLRAALAKQFKSENPGFSKEDVNDAVDVWIEYNQKAPLITEVMTPISISTRASLHASGKRQSIEIYDIKPIDGGYSVFYVTPGEGKSRLLKIRSDGTAYNVFNENQLTKNKYDISELNSAYRTIEKIKSQKRAEFRKINQDNLTAKAKEKNKDAENIVIKQRLSLEVFDKTIANYINTDGEIVFDFVGEKYGSSKNQLNFNKKNAEVIGAHLINDMSKAEQVFDMLASIDGAFLSDTHKEFLRKALQGLTGPLSKVIPDMVQYIDTYASENKGQVILEGNEKGLYVNASRSPWTRRNQMSSAETYVHELFHAALEYAQRDYKDILAETMSDIDGVYKQFLDVVTVEDFMPELGQSIDKAAERKQAQEMLDYIRNPKTGMNEFIVMSMTNEVVKNVLQNKVNVKEKSRKRSGLWDHLVGLITSVYDFIYRFARNNNNLDGYTAMAKFVGEIKNINNKSIQEINKQNIFLKQVGVIFDFLNTTLASWLKFLAKQVTANKGTPEYNRMVANFEKLAEKQINDDPNMSVWQKLKLVGLIIRFGTKTSNQAHVGAFETLLSMLPFIGNMDLSKQSFMSPEGSFQQLLRSARESDAYETMIEKLGLVAGKVEYASETALARMAAIVSGLYGRKLTKQESIALTKGLVEVELDSLFDELLENDEASALETAKKVLSDKSARAKEIKDTEDKIFALEKNKKAARIMISQAKGLGEYMITGESAEYQLMNSYMIVGFANLDRSMSNISERNELGKVKRALVDKLATLHAIENNDSTVNEKVHSLIVEDSEATIALMKLDRSAREEMKRNEKKAGSYDMHKIKGQRYKTGAQWIHSKVSLKKNEDKLSGENFTREENLTFNDEFSVFINSGTNERGWKNEDLITTNDGEPINSYVSIMSEDNLDPEDMFDVEKKKESKKKIKEMLLKKQGEFLDGIELMADPNFVPKKTGMRPVFSVNARGDIFVTDMDINVNKRKLEEIERTDNRVDLVVGKTMSRAISLHGAIQANRVLLDVLEADSFENFDDTRNPNMGGKTNAMEYVKIGEMEDNILSREIWQTIPRYMKEDINNRHYNNINRDIANLLDGTPISRDAILDSKADELFATMKSVAKNPKSTPEDVNKANRKYASYVKSKIKEYVKDNKNSDGVSDLIKSIETITSVSPYIAVRRNMVYHAFGFREASVLAWIEEKIPGIFGTNVVRGANKVIKYLDMLWKHLIKTIKVNIVVRDLPVLIGNIISNFLLAVLDGNNPFSEIKAQMAGIKHLYRYKTDFKIQSELLIKKQAGIITKNEDNELLAVMQSIKNNPVMPLVNAGLYTSMAEDLGNSDLHSKTYLDYKQEQAMDWLPDGVKSALDVAFLTKGTQGFQVLLLAMQSSDFAARYATYYRLINKGWSKDKALKRVLDNQINYGFNSGKLLEWLNARGLIMFSKFFEKIQRVLVTLVGERPANVLMAAASQDFMYDDSPLGDSIFERGLTSVMYNPLDSGLILTEMPAMYQIFSGDY